MIEGSSVVCTLQGMVSPKWIPNATKVRNQKVITLITANGYYITLTPDHPVLTPTGVQEAAKAKCLRICTIPVTTEFASIPLVCEAISKNRLILKMKKDAAWTTQLLLLTQGIFCSQVSEDTLVIEQPYAARYMKRFGVLDRSVAYNIWLTRKSPGASVTPEACRQVLNLISLQKYNEALAHPMHLRLVQELYSACITGNLTRTFAGRVRKSIKMIPNIDYVIGRESSGEQSRKLLLNTLSEIAGGYYTWSPITKHVKHPAKTDVYNLNILDRCIVNGIEIRGNS